MTLGDGTTTVPLPRGPLADLGGDALYRSLLNAFPDVTVFVFGPDLRYVLVAGAATTRLGWRSDEIVGRLPSEVLPGRAGLDLEELMRATLRGQTCQHEHPGLRDAGAVWQSSLSPLLDDQGAIVGGMIISRNVAEVRDAQRARDESERRFAVALEAAPVMVFSQDRELRFTWANKTFLNPSPDTIIGKTDDEVMSPDGAAATVVHKKEVLATGRGKRVIVEIPTADGVRAFDMTLEPSFEAGAVTGIVGAALDVTDLRQSEQRLQQALEAMLDSVTIQQPVRAEGRVVDFRIDFATANAVDFAGRGRDALVGRTLSELYPGLDDGFLDAYVKVLDTGEPLHALAFPYTDDNGVTRLYDLAATRLGTALLVVWRDITEREEQRDASARADVIRATSEQMQRALLPPAPPRVAGLQFAATYRPASATAEVGGDWYTVIPHGDTDSCVDVVVGDVEGHDGEAAALMARLSAVLTAACRRGLSPTDALREVHDFHESLRTDRLSSVVIGRLDRSSGQLTVVSAGHPPPVVVRRAGAADVVGVTPAPPVGASFGEVPATTIDLDVGDTVLLFSDGLLDPQLDSDQALSAVAELAHNLGTSALQQLTDGLAAATTAYTPSDDVVVLAVRRDG